MNQTKLSEHNGIQPQLAITHIQKDQTGITFRTTIIVTGYSMLKVDVI